MTFNKIVFNKKDIDKDIDFDIVNDFVYYYDKDNDIVFVNSIKKVYDKDNDIVKVNDFDFVKVFDKDFNIVNDFVFDFNKDNKDLLIDNKEKIDILINKNQYDIRQCLNKYTIIDNDIVNLNDCNNKYVFDFDFVNIKDILDNIKDNDNVIVLKSIDKDFVFDNDNVFVSLTMSKKSYNDFYYDIYNFIVLSYNKVNYDNDIVKVIIDFKNIDNVLNLINAIYIPLNIIKSYKMFNNQLIKALNDFDLMKKEYKSILLSQLKKDLKRKNYLIKAGNAKQRHIKALQRKIDLLDNEKLNIESYRQYAIKNNCYYDLFNKKVNDFYKSFKNTDSLINLKNDFKDIDNVKDKVNKDFKNKDFKDIDFDIVIDKDFVFNIDIVIDNKNLKNFVLKVKDIVNDFLFNLKLNNDFDKDYLFNNVLNDLKDIDNDLYFEKISIDNAIDNINIIKDIILNYYPYAIKYLSNYDITIKYFDYFDNNYKQSILDKVFDFIDNLNDFDKDNDNDFVYNKYYNALTEKMTKHNAIIKKEKTDFLSIAYNNDTYDSFINLDSYDTYDTF